MSKRQEDLTLPRTDIVPGSEQEFGAGAAYRQGGNQSSRDVTRR